MTSSARLRLPTARDLMTRRLVTFRPEMRVEEAARLLLKHEISGAPVVSEEGCLVGLLSELDCLRAVAAGEYDLGRRDVVVTVGELMSEPSYVVPPEMELFAIAHEFVKLPVRRFPVVEDGRLLGQISRRDVLRAAFALRERATRTRDYPDYPEGRKPIRDYPR